MPEKTDRTGSAAARPQMGDHPTATVGSPAAPVVILSYAYSGADLVQQALAEGTHLACTAATGILPLCEMAAATWGQIDDRPGQARSRLALSSIRTMVTTQIATILAATDGMRRWCELATSAPSAAETFLQIFPATRFVCVHRACTSMMSAAVTAQPWGLVSPVISQFTVGYPGNNIAAVAAYWTTATERLLTFEAAHPQAASRVRHEDVVADPSQALDTIRSSLRLNQQASPRLLPSFPCRSEPVREDQDDREPQVPTDLIPVTLRKTITDLHAQLGYPPISSTIP